MLASSNSNNKLKRKNSPSNWYNRKTKEARAIRKKSRRKDLENLSTTKATISSPAEVSLMIRMTQKILIKMNQANKYFHKT